jgi:receptor protein-tyrosine kinase
MVTSAVPGEGKTFIAFNLALSIAMERDSTVLLIDADTTRRSLSRLLGIDSSRGLLDLLAGEHFDAQPALLRTNVDRLMLLPAGARRRHATELLASEAMAQLVEHLTARYSDRILVFDTPPLLGAPEPAVLASHMGQIVVVVEADSTTHRTLKSALALVESCPVVTTVLNKASSTESGYYYYAA